MLRSYFEKIKERELVEKIKLEKKSSYLKNRIKEIDRFIEILTEKCDPNYDSFTPRQGDIKNKDKILELTKEKEKINICMIENENQIKVNEDNLKELENIMSYIENMELEKQKEEQNDLSEEEEETEFILDDTHEKESEDKYLKCKIEKIEQIVKKIESAILFIDVDRNRSKIEFYNLVPQLKSEINDIKTSLLISEDNNTERLLENVSRETFDNK